MSVTFTECTAKHYNKYILTFVTSMHSMVFLRKLVNVYSCAWWRVFHYIHISQAPIFTIFWIHALYYVYAIYNDDAYADTNDVYKSTDFQNGFDTYICNVACIFSCWVIFIIIIMCISCVGWDLLGSCVYNIYRICM